MVQRGIVVPEYEDMKEDKEEELSPPTPPSIEGIPSSN
jgi:hypothetical protein